MPQMDTQHYSAINIYYVVPQTRAQLIKNNNDLLVVDINSRLDTS